MRSVKRTIPQYEVTIWLTDCRQKAKRLVESQTETKSKEYFNEDAAGMTYYHPKYKTAILCVADNKLSSLCHECVHLVDYIALSIESDIHADSEPWAYMADWVFREFLENVWLIEDEQ